MSPITRSALCAALLVTSALPALAKLPPPSDEAKAKAAETAAKAAWSGKVAAFHLCTVTNRVVENYHASMKQAGKDTPPQMDPVSACNDPGPYVAPAAHEAQAKGDK